METIETLPAQDPMFRPPSGSYNDYTGAPSSRIGPYSSHSSLGESGSLERLFHTGSDQGLKPSAYDYANSVDDKGWPRDLSDDVTIEDYNSGKAYWSKTPYRTNGQQSKPSSNADRTKKKSKKYKQKKQLSELPPIKETSSGGSVENHNIYSDPPKKQSDALKIGAAAAGGAAMATTAIVATEAAAAGGCCCASAMVAKVVSVVVLVGVVSGVAYASFTGVAAALEKPPSFTTEFTMELDFTTLPSTMLHVTTTVPLATTITSPCQGEQINSSLSDTIHYVQDDQRCSQLAPGFYAHNTCAGYFLCCSQGLLGGEGACPQNYTFNPQTQTCEFSKFTFYRDPMDCQKFYRCYPSPDPASPPVRTEQQWCNTPEYFSMEIPVPACVGKDQVPECMVSIPSPSAIDVTF